MPQRDGSSIQKQAWRAVVTLDIRGSLAGVIALALFASACMGPASAQSLQSTNRAAISNQNTNAAAVAQQAAQGGLSPAQTQALQQQLALQARNAAAIQNLQNAQNAARGLAIQDPGNNLFNGAGQLINGVGKGGLDPANAAGGLYIIDANGNQLPYKDGQVLLPGQRIQGQNLTTDPANTGNRSTFQGLSGIDQTTTADGKTDVTIHQNTAQAIFSWNTFNVGKDTELLFDQGGNKGWVALNRVVNAIAPSQILGHIQADGQVYVINSNGIIFGGSSQVNVNALVASSASITDAQLASGLYSQQDATGTQLLPSFTGAGGPVEVLPGAQITANKPTSATTGGGFILLMGTGVTNAGTITAPQGQVELAAGDNFILRPGYSSNGNAFSTTAGNEIAVTLNTLGSSINGGSGAVTNTGVISAPIGDITLAGETVTQAGAALSTTSVSTRGTIHLLTAASDPYAIVTLTPGSVTAITPDTSGATALDSQRAALLASSVKENGLRLPNPQFNNLSLLPDRQDQSRIEIVSGGSVDFQGDSLTVATGGQVAVSAVNRIQTHSGVMIDVSGSNVVLPATANQLAVSIEGFELRDAPVNRDTGRLNSATAFVDKTQLTLVPAGTGGYASDRYYTPGGLLEVGGVLANAPHTIGEYTALGGTITLSTGASGSLVAQPGSVFNISGGSVQYQSGYIQQTYLQGSDGIIYNINSAPSSISYKGIYDGFVVDHAHWGVNETFGNELLQPQAFKPGYTVGRDAGQLILSTPTSIFEGKIDAAVINGQYQTQSRLGTVQPLGASSRAVPDPANPTDSTQNITLPNDPYFLTQNTVALPGTLTFGQYISGVVFSNGAGTAESFGPSSSNVLFQNGAASLAASISNTATPLPANRVNTAYFDAGQISGFGLGGITIDVTASTTAPGGSVAIASPLSLSPGGSLIVNASALDIAATVTARSGSVSGSNVSSVSGLSNNIVLEQTGAIDTRGLWTNLTIDPTGAFGQAFVNGGPVNLTGNITLSTGSLIDASSGAALLANGSIKGGAGGNITLTTPSLINQPTNFVFGGLLRSQGVTKGGALSIVAPPSILIGDGVSGNPGQIVLPTSFFSQGFSSYSLTAGGLNLLSGDSISIAPRTVLNVTEPLLTVTEASFATPTGADPASALALILPPLYAQNPMKDTLTLRPGASLALKAAPSSYPNAGGLTVGAGSIINLDPGQQFLAQTSFFGKTDAFGNFTFVSAGQLTIGDNAEIHAPGGSIDLTGGPPSGATNALSIWLGNNSLLDVAGRAVSATDSYGYRYGVAPAGGEVTLGAAGRIIPVGDSSNGSVNSTDAFIILRPGSDIEAGGSSVTIDALTQSDRALQGRAPLTISGNGGSISLSSYTGIYNDGVLRAPAGGPGASGGTLNVTLEHPIVQSSPLPDYNFDRILTIGQTAEASGLPANLTPGAYDPSLAIGQAYFSANQIKAGGFDTLTLFGKEAIAFNGNVSLTAGRSIQFFQGPISETNANANVTVDAPYVSFTGYVPPNVVRQQVYPIGFAASTQTGTGNFTVNGGLIDVLSGPITFGQSLAPVDYAGFQNVVLNSTGDIRFSNAQFSAPNNLTLEALQIYPLTGTASAVSAGGGVNNVVTTPTTLKPGGSLTIESAGGAAPPLPYSVFGSLTLVASTINQGGVIRAPGGSIFLGSTSPNVAPAGAVNLLPGSITSVSTAGLDIPYGGSADGVTYNVNGSPFTLGTGASSSGFITLTGQSIAISRGATVDVSGGGALLGASFISGRGGSVDTLANTLLTLNPSSKTFSAPPRSSNPVYAIVPGAQVTTPSAAFTDTAYNGSLPGIGDQVTVAGGVPGLAAGTYTLLPANYALLPGAFRVQVGGNAASPVPAVATANGSYIITGYKSVANTSIVSKQPNVLTVTPGSAVRTYSQYAETTYDAFALQSAKTLNQNQPALFADAKTLTLNFNSPLANALAFTNQGTVLTQPGDGGLGAVVNIARNSNMPLAFEIVDMAPTPGFTGVSLQASSLDALNADTLFVGGDYPGGNFSSIADTLYVRNGAVLSAPTVFLLGGSGGITLDPGSSVNTLGFGAPTRDYSHGIFYGTGPSIVAVSNGQLVFLNNRSSYGGFAGPVTVSNGAQLYSNGSIAFSTTQALNFGADVQYGTKNITIAGTNINIGTPAALAGASVPDGLSLNNDVLTRLLSGNPPVGSPALQSLSLTALDSVNFFGTVNINTINPATGKSSLAELDINAPGIYGYGSSTDVATLTTGKFVWNGIGNVNRITGQVASNVAAPPAIANGPGSGSGSLNIVADQIVFGYPALSQAQNQIALSRTILGFSSVNLTANTQIAANNNGTLGIYQSRSYNASTYSFQNSGGNLSISTPLITGDSGSIFSVTTGGALTIASAGGASPNLAAINTLGAELNLNANSIAIDTAVVLPSGSLSLVAAQNITLGGQAKIDLSGRSVPLFDLIQNSPGGIVSFESSYGSITQASGSVINVSAVNNDAGSVSFSATGGTAALNGTLLGSSTSTGFGQFKGGSFSVAAQSFGGFDALNAQLNAGGFYQSRSFDQKQGDLIIMGGSGVKAGKVEVSVDAGGLTVIGLIDASGATPGTIRLAASNNLTLASTAVLDARGLTLRTDSYGQPIDAQNKSVVELTTANGTLTLNAGARIDMRSPDGVNRGELTFNAPRNATGDGALISARQPLNVLGAKSIVLNGFAAYSPKVQQVTDPNTGAQSSLFYIDQAYFNTTINPANAAFINAATANGAFQSAISGLTSQGGAFHLRPGVEIDSTSNLTISGDLDLSTFRYGPNVNAAAPGSGEPGTLLLRAGGNLNVTGTVNDGFNTTGLPANNTWSLTTGSSGLASNVIVGANGATLPAGTQFAPGTILSFPLAINGTSIVSNQTDFSQGTYAILPAGGIQLTSDYYTSSDTQALTLNATPPKNYNFTLPANTASPFNIEINGSLLITGGTFTLSAADMLANYKTYSSFNGNISTALNYSGLFYATDGINPATSYGVYAQDRFFKQIGTTSRSCNCATIPDGYTLVPNPTTVPSAIQNLGRNLVNTANQPVNSIILAAGDAFPMSITLGAGALGSGSQGFFVTTGSGGYQTYSNTKTLSSANPTIFPAGTTLTANASKFVLGPQSNGGSDLITIQVVVTPGPALTSGTVLPVPITLEAPNTVTSSFVATGTISDAFGNTIYSAGQYVSASPANPVTLAAGDVLGAGVTLPNASSTGVSGLTGRTYVNPPWLFSNNILWPSGVPLSFASTTSATINDLQVTIPGISLTTAAVLNAGGVIPAGTILPKTNGGAAAPLVLRSNAVDYSLAPLQAAGTESWSYRFVGGADVLAADTRLMTANNLLGGYGNVTLSDPHASSAASTVPTPSYIRTGTGDLDILAGGDYSQTSLYGVYTAGTQLAINPATGAPGPSPLSGYAVVGGGDVLIAAQGNLTSYAIASVGGQTYSGESTLVGGWLWRQAGVGLTTSWGVNFAPSKNVGSGVAGGISEGFTGFGALAGGNVTILAGDDAGDVTPPLSSVSDNRIVAAIGGSGYVASNGQVIQTGGGALTLNVRGALNPEQGFPLSNLVALNYGALTDLRGAVAVNAGSIGFVPVIYGASAPLTPNPFAVIPQAGNGGISLFLGDAAASVITRGDLVAGNAGNPGNVSEIKASISGIASFSLWTDRTALSYASLGGNISENLGINAPTIAGTNANFFVPSKVSAVALSGNIVASGTGFGNPVELAPSATGQLELVAAGGIYAGNSPIAISGAGPSSETNVFKPLLYRNIAGQGIVATNASASAFLTPPGYPNGANYAPLVAFGPDTPTSNVHAADPNPARIYAVNGNITNLQFGATRASPVDSSQIWYLAAKPAEIRAGGDIVNLNTVILNNNATDISTITAGGDIFYANAKIAGPGLLEVQAGRNIYQGAQGQLESVGVLFNVDQNSRSGGAGITVLAGAGARGPDYAAFAKLYLDPANLADPALPLTSQPGKVAQNYDGELVTWLDGRYGFSAALRSDPDFAKLAPAQQNAMLQSLAYAYFKTLPAAQQAVFVRQIYFEELAAGGREYNDPQSPRYKSYGRSREAVTALFPSVDGNGDPLVYQGDFTAFYSSSANTGSFIRTDFGGDIQTLTPGGQTLIGVEGAPPGPNSGFLTQGQGNIDIYALNSILLGQSRVFTTFGGNILAYSATGDINAGRGSKTTQIYSPPRRIYDTYGNVTLSPAVPSTGAGFATLNPIPEIPPGNIDLIAPLGTVDAGEAGIRVSGNLNIAAFQVLNANNIQVGGKSVGVPTLPSTDSGALSVAGNNAAAATKADDPKSEARERPAIIIVEVLGYGGDNPCATDPKSPGCANSPKAQPQGADKKPGNQVYNSQSPVQVLGYGDLISDANKQKLTEKERLSITN